MTQRLPHGLGSGWASPHHMTQSMRRSHTVRSTTEEEGSEAEEQIVDDVGTLYGASRQRDGVP